MVTELGEIAQAREIIDREVRHLSRFAHHLPTSLKLGAMLEVPSLLYQLDELMEAVDFVSVGSNDLFQFVMAIDRGNTQLSDRFDPLSVPFLRVLKQIADAGVATGTPVTLVRRTRRQADLGDGADRPRLPLDLDVAGLDRPGQGDADRIAVATSCKTSSTTTSWQPAQAAADMRRDAAVPLPSDTVDSAIADSQQHDQPAPRTDGPSSSSVSTCSKRRWRPGRRRKPM